MVIRSEPLSPQPSVLSTEQLDLLSRVTVTIVDLADGYLALTLGATITLDTAAGHGWCVDRHRSYQKSLCRTVSVPADEP